MSVREAMFALALVGVVVSATGHQDQAAPEPLPSAVRRLDTLLGEQQIAQKALKQQVDLLVAGDQAARALETKVTALETTLAALRTELEQVRDQPREALQLARASGARAAIEYRPGGYGIALGTSADDFAAVDLGFDGAGVGLRMRGTSQRDLVHLGLVDGGEQPNLDIYRRGGAHDGSRAVRLGPGELVLYGDDGEPLITLGTDGGKRCYLVLGRPRDSRKIVLMLDRDQGGSIRIDGQELKVR